jgi:hypothetical protein
MALSSIIREPILPMSERAACGYQSKDILVLSIRKLESASPFVGWISQKRGTLVQSDYRFGCTTPLDGMITRILPLSTIVSTFHTSQ